MPGSDRAAFHAALRQGGLPRPGKGAWEHSDVVALVREALQSCETQPLKLDATGAEITDWQDLTVAGDSNFTGKDPGVFEYPLAQVNGLLFNNGIAVRVPAKADEPARLALRAGKSPLDRIAISIGARSSLSMVETFTGGNRVVECMVEDGADFNCEFTQPRTSVPGYYHLHVTLGVDATARINFAAQGGELNRFDIHVHLEGDSSRAKVIGGWSLQGQNHLDLHVALVHQGKATSSTQTLNGVVADAGRSAFSGLIYITENAVGTVAHLKNQNVAVSDRARAVTKPELQIYTDDVVCSHGATTGQLDDEMIFYLQSRGITGETARRLLVQGFLRNVVLTQSGRALLGL